jgi:hypothetical protein
MNALKDFILTGTLQFFLQGAESCEQKSKVYIKDLPYSIFHKLFTYLQLATTLGQDWRSLGGMGLNFYGDCYILKLI